MSAITSEFILELIGRKNEIRVQLNFNKREASDFVTIVAGGRVLAKVLYNRLLEVAPCEQKWDIIGRLKVDAILFEGQG